MEFRHWKGYSVLQIVKAFEKVSGHKLPYKIEKRRPGDVASSYANPKKAFIDLKWKAKYDLHKMIEDAWRWHKMNPNGY